MGGKKKKGLGNRLAKMNDEERARYLQHRAAIEEEAKRRKEQLIATYMKNKLKREEAFTRLNIAKINEYWHQILRKIKVKELRTEIEDLSLWITKVVDIKNSIIKRLMVEIEEAELQYQHNLQAHLSHIDHFLDIHYRRQDDLTYNYENHKTCVVEDAVAEMNKHKVDMEKEERYLKTVLFTMETNFNDIQKQLKSHREGKMEDYTNSLKSERETMVKNYSMKMDKLWKDINSTLNEYLSRTTVRRHHYIELKYLDDRNTAERLDNERRIARHTELIASLKNEYEELYENNENQIKTLINQQKILGKKFRDLKQNLTATIKKDEKKLMNMTVISNNVIKELEKTLAKGESVNQMVVCCRRLETEEEKLMCWAKMHGMYTETENSLKEDSSRDAMEKEGSVKDEETNDVEELEKEEIKEEDKSEEEHSANEKDETVSQYSQASKTPDLPSEFEWLQKLDGFWWCYNRIALDCVQMRNEKPILIAENRKLKETIKEILREAALEPPAPPNYPTYQTRPKIMSAPTSSSSSSVNSLKLGYVSIDF